MNRRIMQVMATLIAVGMLAGIAVLGATLTTGGDVVEARERQRPPLPEGDTRPGRAGAEASAIDMADELQAVPLRSGGVCPKDRLEVSWNRPEDFRRGSHVGPVGPAPDEDTDEVNGIVSCRNSEYAYSGFTGEYDGAWDIRIVPNFDETEATGPVPSGSSPDPRPGSAQPEQGEGGAGAPSEGDEGPATGPQDTVLPSDDRDAPEPPDVGTGAGTVVPGESPTLHPQLEADSPWVGLWDEEIEPLASYQPQQVCAPSEKPGMASFRELVLQVYTFTADYGISRECSRGGRSEHKEGRAWDWGVDVGDPRDKQAAAEVIGWLLATDEYGHDYAMARRLGVMYVIFNGHIWSSYDADDGWRPYNGPNAHTDHVHISLNIDGAQGATSFWRVDVLEAFGLGAFGPAAILPEYDGASLAYGVPPRDVNGPEEEEDSPSGSGGSGNGSPAPVVPSPSPGAGNGGTTSGGGSDGGGSGLPLSPPALPPAPALPPLPPAPTPTVPPLPGGLPLCPAGTPLFPLPTHCVLPESQDDGTLP